VSVFLFFANWAISEGIDCFVIFSEWRRYFGQIYYSIL